MGADVAAGEAPASVDPHSCDPAYLRPTTTVFPGAQTLRARWAIWVQDLLQVNIMIRLRLQSGPNRRFDDLTYVS